MAIRSAIQMAEHTGIAGHDGMCADVNVLGDLDLVVQPPNKLSYQVYLYIGNVEPKQASGGP
ncbi:hypothetical protein GCM10007898_36680 [Dyella flagellata]|uniref:Uncharacterized protein n=1 Tax=Dyella flagellata TaxID=1867833 RepID=A0ABQ5XEM1_9GAMM|nr:hypothetical protein GCM10007898_36680 [Dyella flagellata]